MRCIIPKEIIEIRLSQITNGNSAWVFTAPDLVSNSRVKLGYVLPSSANNPSAVAKQPQTVPAGTLAPRLITAAQIAVTQGEANRT